MEYGLIFHGKRTGKYYFKNMKYRINIAYYTSKSEITWPYSTTSVISGLFYTSYSPVVSQDASILARISGSQ